MKIGPLEINLKFGQTPAATSVAPTREAGTRGTEVYGGFVVERERDPSLIGQQRYQTYSDLAVNTSVVAAGVRYFINLVAKPAWKVIPANDTDKGPSDASKKAAEFVEKALFDSLDTPWSRIVRRSVSYVFYGFGISEWTAKVLEDGQLGFKSLNQRPQHTVERWNVDDKGNVLGLWQNSYAQGATDIYIPRKKTVYLVDDALTDSPEGLGIFRHLVEPHKRLVKYLQLEGRGFERDLNGIPVGRVPYAALAQAVSKGIFTQAQADSFKSALETFVSMEAKGTATGLVLDSQPFESLGDNGRSVSSIQQWGIELLKGGSTAFTPMAASIERTNKEMARILGTEGLMLGGDGAGSLALSKDKSLALLLRANSALTDMRDGMSRDLIDSLWLLNAFDNNLKPKLGSEEIQHKDAEAIAKVIKDMATAGAKISPDDPIVSDVRDILGVHDAPPDLKERQVEDAKVSPPPSPGSEGGPGTDRQPGSTRGE